MKIALIIVLVCLCSAIGFGFSNGYKQRKNFFDAYVLFLQSLKTDINFSADKLNEIVKRAIQATSCKDFSNLLANYSNSLTARTELSKDALFKDVKLLTSQEKEQIFRFFSGLGKTDVFNQVEIISNELERGKSAFQKVKSDCEKYCPLFAKLGILTGLFLALIII